MYRYGPTFEEMYQQMEARQRERQNQLRDQAAQGSVLDKVKQVSLLSSSHPYIHVSGILGSDASLLNLGGKPLWIGCRLHVAPDNGCSFAFGCIAGLAEGLVKSFRLLHGTSAMPRESDCCKLTSAGSCSDAGH